MGFLGPLPPIILVLALELLVIAPFTFLAGRRGGRYRALPGWIGFWCFFAAMLVVLSRAHLWVSVPVFAIFMFAGLRQYFFLTPVRPQDRWAIVAAYLSIVAAVWPAFAVVGGAYHVAPPVVFFLAIPVFLSRGASKRGLLDSMGRVVFGVLIFVFCAAHLSLQVHEAEGRLELFGILALAAELPQRLVGRIGSGAARGQVLRGIGMSLVLAAGLGWAIGPMASVPSRHGLVAGLLIVATVAAGHLVASSVAEDLDMAASDKVVGRAAFLDRVIPAVYAAPVYYHFLRSVL